MHNEEIIKAELSILHHKINKIMSTQAEIAQGLSDLTAQVTKIGEESKATLQKVADLEAALANNGTVSPELQTAFDNLKAQVKTVDDLIPDTTPPAQG